MAEKQLIVVVEGTAALGPYWKTILSDYLDKIIRSFCAGDAGGLKPSAPAASGSTFELALVMFNTHGPYSGSVVQRSGWTRDADNFFGWLSALSFSGGGWNDVATAEGLAEALMMFAIPQNGYKAQQNTDGKKHCILVSASNPYPLPTPVYRPAIEDLEQVENGETQTESLLHDAETVSRWFGQCSVSLSVICPKQLPKLKAIYYAAKCNQRASQLAVDVKQPHFLVLVSDSFLEACAALRLSGLPSSENPSATLPPGSGAPTSPSVNGSTMNRQSITAENVPQATVKVEPSTATSIASGPVRPHMPSMPRASAQSVSSLQALSPPSVSQEMSANGERMPELKPTVNTSQSVRPVGAILNNLSRVALSGTTSLGLPSVGVNPIGMHMSSMISTGMASSVPQTLLSSGQSGVPAVSGSGAVTGTSQPVQNTTINSLSTANSNVAADSKLGILQPPTSLQGSVNNTVGPTVSGFGQGNIPSMPQSGSSMNPNMIPSPGTPGGPSSPGSMIPVPGMSQQVQSEIQSVGMSSSAAMQISQQGSASLPSSQSKYVKLWEGNLSAIRQGQHVLITKLEAYRNATASETLAANWPSTMQISRLVSQDLMNSKQFVGKADFLVFRAVIPHGLLPQMQEKRLCAVIHLPSQAMPLQTLLLSVSDKACRLIGMLFPENLQLHQLQNQQMQQQQQHSQLQQLQQSMQPLQQQQLPQMQQSFQHMPQQQPTTQLQQQQHISQQRQQQIPQLRQQQQIPQLQQQQQIPQLQQQQQQIPQLQQQQQQMPQLQQRQQVSQLQQQQLQPQQMVGNGMGQGYMQGTGRQQLHSQAQVPSQGTQSYSQGTQPNMPGGGFMG